MSDTTRINVTSPEDALEEEIEDLERPMLHSFLPWAVAFVSLMLLTGTLAFFFILSPRQGHYRGPTQGGHPQLSLSEPQGRLSGSPKVFRWEAVQGAAKYVITVTRGDDEVVLLRPVSDVQMVPSAEEADVFRPGTYTWMVEARGPDDQTLAEGETAFVLAGS